MKIFGQEILTGKLPFEHLAKDIHVMLFIIDNQLPNAPEDLKARPAFHQKLWNLCQSCWERVPAQRPSMTSIMEDLIPPNPA
jgi:hypothetical protein